MKKVWQSKKFWAAVIAAIVAFAKEWGIDIPPELLYVIIAYILGQGIADVGVYMGQNHKPTKEQKEPPAPVEYQPEPLQVPYTKSADEMMPRPTSATRAFQIHWNTPYQLTNPDDPVQVEKDYIGHYETALELAKRMFEERRGYYPEKEIEDPCRTGDWSYESRWLRYCQQELQIRKDMVAAIKKNPDMKYQLGGLGYLLHGVEWNSIPEWARLNLMQHIKTTK